MENKKLSLLERIKGLFKTTEEVVKVENEKVKLPGFVIEYIEDCKDDIDWDDKKGDIEVLKEYFSYKLYEDFEDEMDDEMDNWFRDDSNLPVSKIFKALEHGYEEETHRTVYVFDKEEFDLEGYFVRPLHQLGDDNATIGEISYINSNHYDSYMEELTIAFTLEELKTQSNKDTITHILGTEDYMKYFKEVRIEIEDLYSDDSDYIFESPYGLLNFGSSDVEEDDDDEEDEY